MCNQVINTQIPIFHISDIELQLILNNSFLMRTQNLLLKILSKQPFKVLQAYGAVSSVVQLINIRKMDVEIYIWVKDEQESTTVYLLHYPKPLHLPLVP